MKELILSGSVQGVFCRYYCRENAKKVGLRGSATNLSNGNVQVIIDSNDDEKIKLFIKNLRENPYNVRFYGRITDIEVNDYGGSIDGDYNF